MENFGRQVQLIFPNFSYTMKNVNDIEALKVIGRLVVSARVQQGKTQVGLAKEAGVDVKTLRTLEGGDHLLQDTKLHAIEKVLGWRAMSIRQVWDVRDHIDLDSVTTDDMKLGSQHGGWGELAAEASKPVTKASQLTTEELVLDLLYRVRHYEVELSRMKAEREASTTDH